MAVYFDRPDLQLERSTFFREKEWIVIDCIATTSVALTFNGAAPQVMRFAGPLEAMFFQNDLESELARTGWTLVACEPTAVTTNRSASAGVSSRVLPRS